MTRLEQEIAHLEELQAKHRKNIRALEEQLANYGMDQPLPLLNNLDFEREQLRQVEEQLAAALAAQAEAEEAPIAGGGQGQPSVHGVGAGPGLPASDSQPRVATQHGDPSPRPDTARPLQEPLQVSITITLEIRSRLIDALLSVPAARTPEGRTALLGGIPSSISLNRNNANARADIAGIVDQLNQLGCLVSGDWPLLVLIDSALQYVEGTEAGQKLEAIRRTLAGLYGEA